MPLLCNATQYVCGAKISSNFKAKLFIFFFINRYESIINYKSRRSRISAKFIKDSFTIKQNIMVYKKYIVFVEKVSNDIFHHRLLTCLNYVMPHIIHVVQKSALVSKQD